MTNKYFAVVGWPEDPETVRSLDFDALKRLGGQTVDAMVPMAEMFGYATSLRSFTQGRGTFTMEFDHYEPVSAEIAERIALGYQR